MVCVHFVRPWFTLPLLIRVLWESLAVLFIVLVLVLVAVSVKIAIAVRKTFGESLLLLLLELGLVVLLVVDLDEARQSLVWGDAPLSFKDVDHDAIRSLLDPLPCEASFFSEASLVADVGFVSQIVDAVKELAPLSVHAVSLLLVLAAQLGLVV